RGIPYGFAISLVLLRLTPVRCDTWRNLHCRLDPAPPYHHAPDLRTSDSGLLRPHLLWTVHLAFPNFCVDQQLGDATLPHDIFDRLAFDVCGVHRIVLFDRAAFHAGATRLDIGIDESGSCKVSRG